MALHWLEASAVEPTIDLSIVNAKATFFVHLIQTMVNQRMQFNTLTFFFYQNLKSLILSWALKCNETTAKFDE